MALDTRNKRASAVNVGSPWRGMLPVPDGSISAVDRQQVAFLYAGIAAAVPAAVFLMVVTRSAHADPVTRSARADGVSRSARGDGVRRGGGGRA